MGKLDKLDQQVRTCRLCRLCRGRLNGVPGDGNESAEVLFIGEGPGFNEDREGKPFVGAAGQFLDELLGIAGFRRPDVYITNVVKCRPPQNRDPLPDEIDACSPYLERQIAAIDPLLIVTLGRFSMARFFPGDKISSVHGQARPVDGRIVMTMWHPAYGLRDNAGRESLKDDFRKMPAVLEQARALRSQRTRPAPQPRRDFSALVAQHLDTPAFEPVAAPPPATPVEDGYAYLTAVTGQTGPAAPRGIAESGGVDVAWVAGGAPVEVPREPVVAAETEVIVVAPSQAPEVAVAAKPRRVRATKADAAASPVAAVAPPADEAAAVPAGAPEAATVPAGAAEAPVASGLLPGAVKKKGKPGPDFQQLNLF